MCLEGCILWQGLIWKRCSHNIWKKLLDIQMGMAFVKLVHTLKWPRCVFNPDIKCDHISSNIGGVFNNWIRDIMELLLN